MRIICFFFTILIAGTATAAGLQQLFDSLKKPPVVTPQPAPHPPTAPAPQAPKPPVKK